MKLERLMELRDEKGLSQDELADYLNVSKIQYARDECGISSISLNLLMALAKFYDTSTDYLLNLTDVKEKYPTKEKITN